ncbi:MAG: sigma-70 family RNA polymerase sigma factor, partial [Phycisphaeraceae bacterium]|nr:sigma-70 family RNA polymerase sigma factor [Phycisphaeraceae bacterium]
TRLLMANQRRIYGFILALVHDRTHADDLQQEVASVLWKKFDRYEAGTDFAAWAMRTARLSIYEWRRKQARLPLPMNEQTFDRVADDAMAVADQLEDRLGALRQCMDSVDEPHRQLLEARYGAGEPVRGIAERFGLSRRAVYNRLNKIHSRLLDCIRGKLGPERTP